MYLPTHFRIFLLLLSLKAILSCLDDQCRELEFPGSYLFYGERLVNHVIRTIKVLDQDFCELQCYREYNCVSINFDLTGTHNCDLNNATHKELEKDLVKKEGYVYHGTMNACGKALCEHNATCQTGFTSKGYRCLCSSGFTGEKCELDIDECKEKTSSCDGNALCNNTIGSYICICKAGYSGDGHDCAAKDFCAVQNPCRNGGECESTRDGYFCRCEVGFAGKTCETKLPVSSTILSKNASYASHLLHFLGPAVINDSQWKLCYRASLNGWDALTFHSLCDGKKNTVTIIESNQYVFGGYTGAPWGSLCPSPGKFCYFPFEFEGKTYRHCTTDGSFFSSLWCSLDSVYRDNYVYCGDAHSTSSYGGYRSTNEAFIYSLRNKEGIRPFKSMVKTPSQAIYMNPLYGPTFGGGHSIYIADKANGNSNSYAQLGHSYNYPSGVKNHRTILAGRFTPDEVEVFYLL